MDAIVASLILEHHGHVHLLPIQEQAECEITETNPQKIRRSMSIFTTEGIPDHDHYKAVFLVGKERAEVELTNLHLLPFYIQGKIKRYRGTIK